MSDKVIRVFPRGTNATPDDIDAYVGPPNFWVKADAVEISVAFSWDMPEAERLAREWGKIGRVTIGGPATGQRGGVFVPGKYLKKGYVITSRGCPNQCWFCDVWKREGEVRELPITEGYNLLDDNILACSEAHIRAVFAMLKQQSRRAELTGGLEAARLKDWHVELLMDLKPKQVFFAYDTPDDWDPLVVAARRMRSAGFTAASHRLRAYVLIGYPCDTRSLAEARLKTVCRLGVSPMAMLWRSRDNATTAEWRRFQRSWARPGAIHAQRRWVNCP